MSHDFLPKGWGIHPVLFRIGNFSVPSYDTMIILGILVGLFVYILLSGQEKGCEDRSLYLLVAALVGGAIGAKIPTLMLHWAEIAHAHSLMAFLSGRTILGGLIGGTLAVILTRKKLGMSQKLGNYFAPALAIGIALGRIGCFLRGCCYGKPTHLPWGVNFGDGILRQPTQIYESIFCFVLFLYLLFAMRRDPPPGALFRQFMLSYFTFRFCIEFVRNDSPSILGLTLAQWVCTAVIAYYLLIDRNYEKLDKNPDGNIDKKPVMVDYRRET